MDNIVVGGCLLWAPDEEEEVDEAFCIQLEEALHLMALLISPKFRRQF